MLVAAFSAWAAAIVLMRFGSPSPPLTGAVGQLLAYGVPIALVGAAVLRRSTHGVLPLVAGAACALSAAAALPSHYAESPKLGLAIPALVVGAFVTRRFPTTALAVIFFITGTYGSIAAFTGLPAVSVADAVIEGLWAGVVGRLLIGRHYAALRPTLALYMLAGFIGVSFLAVFGTTPVSSGIRAFRLAPLYLSVVLLVGYGPFRVNTLEKLMRVMVLVSLLVAAYATLRWAIGTSAKEQALQRTSLSRQYNHLAVSNDLKLQGSLPNGNLLGLWVACTLPFLVAVAISWRGIFRIVAAAAIPLSGIALLGSSQRAGTIAVVAGSLTIVVVHVLSRGFRGPRLGVAIAAALLLIVGGSVIYPAVVNNPQKRKRYENILTPGQDGSFQARLTKWDTTLRQLRGKPFGFGLGAGDPIAVPHRFADIGAQEVDNSYLMVAYDQGLAVMAFFIATMLVLLVELLRFAVWTRAPGPAALSTAAVGTLVAILVEFMSADYIYARPMIAGWMIVGLGVAQFGSRRTQPAVQAGQAPSLASPSLPSTA